MEKLSIFYLVLICSVLSGPLQAQQVWDLSDCIRQALEHNSEIKKQEISIEKREIELRANRQSRLPDLQLGGSQKFDFGRTLTRENTYQDINSRSTAFSLSSEVNLFNGMKTYHTIEQSRIGLTLHTTQKEKLENDLSLQVARYYYQLLLDQEVEKILQEQVELSLELEQMTRELVSHGKAPGAQLLEVQAQLANDGLNLAKAENNIHSSRLELSQLLEVKDPGSFDIVPLPEKEIFQLHYQPEEIYRQAQHLLPELSLADLSIQYQQKQIRIAKADYYPSVNMGGGLSSGYYHYNNLGNDLFKEQFKNNLQKTVYISVNVPLFNRFRTRNQVRTAQKELEEAKVNRDITGKEIYKEIQLIYYDAIAYYKNYQATQKAVEANGEALRYAKEKYNAGKLTVYEYNEIKLKLANSLSEQVQAKYQYVLHSLLLDFYSGKKDKYFNQ